MRVSRNLAAIPLADERAEIVDSDATLKATSDLISFYLFLESLDVIEEKEAEREREREREREPRRSTYRSFRSSRRKRKSTPRGGEIDRVF